MANDLDFAVIIGIENYIGIGPLGGPHGDALRFTDWLLSTDGGKLPKQDMKDNNGNIGRFLSTPDYTPSQDDVDKWLDDTMNRLAAAGKRGRRLYFYFSGHGIGATASNSALLLPKWSYTMRNYALSSEQYFGAFRNKAAFEQLIFLMDCCRNRIVGVQGQQPFWGAPAPSPLSSESLVFNASQFDSASYEASLPGNGTELNNLLPRGLFTEALLAGLSGGAAGRNGRLTVYDLVNYVTMKLKELADSEGITQFPRATIEMDLNEELAGPFPAKVGITINFNTAGEQVVLEDPDLNEIRSGNTDEKTWSLVLGRGWYTIRKSQEAVGKKYYIDGIKTIINYG
jgi:hypothetical protein